MAELEKGSKKLLNAWAFYDWAKSVYSLTIASAIFPIFYDALFDKDNPYITVFGTSVKNSALIRCDRRGSATGEKKRFS